MFMTGVLCTVCGAQVYFLHTEKFAKFSYDLFISTASISLLQLAASPQCDRKTIHSVHPEEKVE